MIVSCVAPINIVLNYVLGVSEHDFDAVELFSHRILHRVLSVGPTCNPPWFYWRTHCYGHLLQPHQRGNVYICCMLGT